MCGGRCKGRKGRLKNTRERGLVVLTLRKTTSKVGGDAMLCGIGRVG